MNTLFTFGKLTVASLIPPVSAIIILFGGAALAQPTNQAAPASDKAAPPSKPFMSPFSLSAIPPYSATNTAPDPTNYSPIVRATLKINPFSRLPMNQVVPPAVPAEVVAFEPVPPPRFEFPPGAFVRSSSSPQSRPAQYGDTSFMISPALSKDTAYFNFPPGANLRSVSPEIQKK
jgi:hypothetical protein